MTEGYNVNELAKRLGREPSWVSERLESLRNELLLNAGLFYPLTEHEYAALRMSILLNGVRSPVIIGEHIACVDGRHRLLIATELELADVPAIFLHGETAEFERALAIGLNAARRQLTTAQKRSIVESELMRDPARSDRVIASIAGVHWTTVGDARAKIEAALAVIVQPHSEETTTVEPAARVGSDGRVIPRKVRVAFRPEDRTEPGIPPLRPAAAPTEEIAGYALCAHGERHAIWKSTRFAGSYRLEAVSA